MEGVAVAHGLLQLLHEGEIMKRRQPANDGSFFISKCHVVGSDGYGPAIPRHHFASSTTAGLATDDRILH